MPALLTLALLAALAQTPASPATPPVATPTSPAPAGPPATSPDPAANPAVATAVRTCAADYAKFCPNIAPTSPDAQQCVRDNFDKMSEPCQSAIMAALGGGGSPG